MERPEDDVSWSEIFERLKIIGIVVGLLMVADLFYRWLTFPNDSFTIYQEALTWVWYHTHSLIFGPESISYVSTDGPATIIEYTHTSFVGAGMYPLEVTDECAGIHEIVFVSFMIWMTPGVSKRLKLRGILVMAGVLSLLNLVRLLVLYPLAVNGCVDNPGDGCWAPMWEFHQFMLEIGFMLVIVLGWTVWYLVVGGPAKTKQAGDLSLRFALPTRVSQRKPLPQLSLVVLLLAGILATYSVHTLGFDDQSEQQRLEAEGCEEINSAYCAEETRQWDNISGKAWRYLLISGIAASFATLKFHGGNSSEEEE
jgi:exosortase/archaeosortase family protein